MRGKIFLPRHFKLLCRILKGGVLYFALVFGAGFMLGTIRTLWVVPRFGTRIAELMEMPIMLIVTIVAARWIALHLAVPFAPLARLGMGAIALVLLLVDDQHGRWGAARRRGDELGGGVGVDAVKRFESEDPVDPGAPGGAGCEPVPRARGRQEQSAHIAR